MTDLPAARMHAWLDVSAGVAGDMLLAALVDAGADLAYVRRAIDGVLPETVHVDTERVSRGGLSALHLRVEAVRPDHPHRAWHDIRHMILGAPIEEVVRRRALRVFTALAEAEGRVHGVEVDAVHFHEVGSWDSIADIVGVCAALTSLGVQSVTATEVSVGSGKVRTAHGWMPVPVPAVAELSRGWRVMAGGEGELATPTGMALVRGLATSCEPLPPMTVDAVGVGAGTKDVPERANVARVMIGRTGQQAEVDDETLTVLEANVDDLDPRVWPTALSTLLEEGALDAWVTPILMKKGRPAHTLSVLTGSATADQLMISMFRLTSTFGVRRYSVTRRALARTWSTVDVDGLAVRIKTSHDHQGRVVHATPEFDDAMDAARAGGLAVREVLRRAMAAYDHHAPPDKASP